MILSDLVLFSRSFVLDSGWFSGSEHNHLLGTHHNSFDRTQVITLIQSWPIGGINSTDCSFPRSPTCNEELCSGAHTDYYMRVSRPDFTYGAFSCSHCVEIRC